MISKGYSNNGGFKDDHQTFFFVLVEILRDAVRGFAVRAGMSRIAIQKVPSDAHTQPPLNFIYYRRRPLPPPLPPRPLALNYNMANRRIKNKRRAAAKHDLFQNITTFLGTNLALLVVALGLMSVVIRLGNMNTILVEITNQVHNNTRLLGDLTNQVHNNTRLLGDLTNQVHNNTRLLVDTRRLVDTIKMSVEGKASSYNLAKVCSVWIQVWPAKNDNDKACGTLVTIDGSNFVVTNKHVTHMLAGGGNEDAIAVPSCRRKITRVYRSGNVTVGMDFDKVFYHVEADLALIAVDSESAENKELV